MKRYKFIIYIVLATLSFNKAIADDKLVTENEATAIDNAKSGGCNSTYCWGKIKKLNIYTDDNIYVTLDAPNPPSQYCNINYGNGGFVIEDKNPRYNEIYSMLLSARLAGSDVGVSIDFNPIISTVPCYITSVQLNDNF